VAVGLDLKHERYMAHLEVPEDESIAVLTTLRVLYLKKGSLSITWQVPYTELLFCRPNFDSVMLSVRQGDVRKRLIFCLDQASQEVLLLLGCDLSKFTTFVFSGSVSKLTRLLLFITKNTVPWNKDGRVGCEGE
jgi:hypothetical protein